MKPELQKAIHYMLVEQDQVIIPLSRRLKTMQVMVTGFTLIMEPIMEKFVKYVDIYSDLEIHEM